jgi:hypothetical protein
MPTSPELAGKLSENEIASKFKKGAKHNSAKSIKIVSLKITKAILEGELFIL